MGNTQLLNNDPQILPTYPILNRLIPFALLFVGFWGYALPAIDYFNAVPGEILDSRFNSVILEHVYRWFIGQEASLWNPRFYYPFERILYFSDNHLGSVMFYIPFRLLGFQREIGFDIWFLISICLNFASAYFSFRMLRFSAIAASVGAFIFAFSLPVLQLELHAQLFYRFQTPLAFAFFWRFLQRRDVADLAKAIFWTAWQLLSSIYLGVFLCYFLGAVLLVWIVSGKFHGIFRDTVQSLLSSFRPKSIPYALLLFGLISFLGWTLIQYMLVRNEYQLSFPEWQRLAFLPQFSSYFSPGDRLFFGFGIGFLFVIGVVFSFRANLHRQIGRASFFGLLIIIAITGKFHDKSLYVLLQHVPGVSAIRAVVRIVLVMTLPVGVIASIAVDGLNQLVSSFWSKKAYIYSYFIVLLLLISAEMVMYTPGNIPINVWRQRQDAVRALLPDVVPADAILMVNAKEGSGHFETEVDGMLVAQDLGIATLNGYSGFLTPNFQPPSPCSSPINRLLAYAEFRNKPAAGILKLANRIIVASPTPCDHKPFIGFFGDVSPEMASSIEIDIMGIGYAKDGISANVKITNHARKPLRTLSLYGHPIRLVWRFIPLGANHTNSGAPDWPNRIETGWSLDGNESRVFNIPIQLPDRKGDFLLEFSMVQESVAFFHDLGMNVARFRIGNK